MYRVAMGLSRRWNLGEDDYTLDEVYAKVARDKAARDKANG